MVGLIAFAVLSEGFERYDGGCVEMSRGGNGGDRGRRD